MQLDALVGERDQHGLGDHWLDLSHGLLVGAPVGLDHLEHDPGSIHT